MKEALQRETFSTTRHFFRQTFSYLLILLALVGCANHPRLNTAEAIEAADFSGDWYVIANIDYFAERDKVGSKVSYIPRDSGGYDDIFSSHNGSFNNPRKTLKGRAWPINEENTEYRSVFYWVIRSQFAVLHHQGDWMLLGHPNRKLGWVMARTTELSDSEYEQALAIFSANQYDTSQFAKVPQKPSDIGKSGYHAIKN